MTSPLLCAVIPACNEARSIEEIVSRCLQQSVQVLVINDGSTDGTAELARKAGAVVVRHKTNKGKGIAIQTAITEVLKRGFDGAIFLDADGQHLPEELPRFLEAYQRTGAALVLGSRMHDNRAMPTIRRWANTASSLVVSLIAGVRITDSQSGFRLLSRHTLELLQRETGTGFELESQMLIMAHRQGLKYVEVPITCIYGEEQSHYRPLRDSSTFIRSMLKEAHHLLKGRIWSRKDKED